MGPIIFLEGKDLNKKVLCLSFLNKNYDFTESLFWDQVSHLIVHPESFERISNRMIVISSAYNLSQFTLSLIFQGYSTLKENNVMLVFDDTSIESFTNKLIRKNSSVLQTTSLQLLSHFSKNSINVDDFCSNETFKKHLKEQLEPA